MTQFKDIFVGITAFFMGTLIVLQGFYINELIESFIISAYFSFLITAPMWISYHIVNAVINTIKDVMKSDLFVSKTKEDIPAQDVHTDAQEGR